MAFTAKGPILDFLKAYGGMAIATFIADAAVEATKFPHLDMIPAGSTDSYFEQYANLFGGALTVLGLVAMFAKREPFGIGKWAIPAGLGLMTGVLVYEHKGAQLLGIRRTAST